MRRVAAAAVLALGAWLLVPVQHADAGSKGGERCVTHEEYRKVHEGMRKTRVERIFDAAGHQSWRTGRYEIRVFTPCTDRRFGWINVNYKDAHVDAKRAFWGG
jgi:hypothetical protein